MLLPYLSETRNPSKKYNVVFKGLNYGEGTQDGEFAETYNLSTDKYPCISQRAERSNRHGFSAPTSIHAKDGLFIIDGTSLHYLYTNEEGKSDVVYKENYVTEGKKQTATIGKYIVVFPDKVYFDVEAKTFGKMEIEYKATGLVFEDDSITIETNDNDDVFEFESGDAVTITGCTMKPENNKKEGSEIIIRGVSKDKKQLTFYENSFTTTYGEDGKLTGETGEVLIKRSVPNLELICESGYRLWGVEGNTIWCSMFERPFNFHVKEGIASDSYSISVATEGKFTGCVPFSSHICFFKENTLHKLYGTKHSNFQITTAKVHGVQSGSEGSMVTVDEQLIYKGVDGVYSYTGGVPELISEKFGTKRFSDAVAACDGSRYYISMKSGYNEWGLYVYDILRDIWIREDDTHAADMTFHEGEIWYLDADDRSLYCIDQTASRNQIEWSATLCTINETINERKGYSKFHLRMDLAQNAWVAVDIKTDNEAQWRQVYITNNAKDWYKPQSKKRRAVSIPIIPTRCDSIDIRIRGKGNCTIKSFVREFTTGSDV